MKKILLTIILLVAGVSVALAYDFDSRMNLLVNEGLVSEIHVSKSVIKMLSPEMQKKIPLLANEDGLSSVTIYTMSSKEAVKQCSALIYIFFQRKMLTVKDGKLLEIKNGADYSAAFGNKPFPDSHFFNRVVIYNTNGKTGQIIVFNGQITPYLLSKITETLSK